MGEAPTAAAHDQRVLPQGRANFVGRARELALLEREIARAAAGRGRIVIVRGEPGVGKTWLVQEALARRDGAAGALPAHRARCSDAIGVPAWWPWRQLLGSSFRLAETAAAEAAAPLADPFEQLHRAAGEVFESAGSGGLLQEPQRRRPAHDRGALQRRGAARTGKANKRWIESR